MSIAVEIERVAISPVRHNRDMLAILRYDRYRRNCVAKLKNEGAGKFRKARKDRRGGREFQAAVKLGEAADYSASGRTSASHHPDNGGNLDRKELNHHLSRTIYDDCAGRHCANVKRFSVKITCSMVISSFVCSIATDIAQQPNVRFYMMGARRKRVLMAETAIQFLERWRQAHVYAELRALEQLDETVAECVGAAAEDDISADDLENAAGGSLKEYLRTAIINTSE